MRRYCNENLLAGASMEAVSPAGLQGMVALTTAPPSNAQAPALLPKCGKPYSPSWVKLHHDTTHKTSLMEDATALRVAQPPARSSPFSVSEEFLW